MAGAVDADDSSCGEDRTTIDLSNGELGHGDLEPLDAHSSTAGENDVCFHRPNMYAGGASYSVGGAKDGGCQDQGRR